MHATMTGQGALHVPGGGMIPVIYRMTVNWAPFASAQGELEGDPMQLMAARRTYKLLHLELGSGGDVELQLGNVHPGSNGNAFTFKVCGPVPHRM